MPTDRAVLSSFGQSRNSVIPVRHSEDSLIFELNGRLTEWVRGTGTNRQPCWLRLQPKPESVIPPTSVADHFFSSDVLLIDAGVNSGFPDGTCLGLGGYVRLPTASDFYHDGWLNPDARFIPCRQFQHDRLANLIMYGTPSPVHAMERAGWIRISDKEPVLVGRSSDTFTDPQYEWLLKHADF